MYAICMYVCIYCFWLLSYLLILLFAHLLFAWFLVVCLRGIELLEGSEHLLGKRLRVLIDASIVENLKFLLGVSKH